MAASELGKAEKGGKNIETAVNRKSKLLTGEKI